MTMTIENDSSATTFPVIPDQVIDASPGEKLLVECGGCRLSFSGIWPSSAKGWDADTKQMIADQLGHGDKSAMRGGGDILYDSKDPWVKKANQLKRDVSNYWVALTLPLAQPHSATVAVEPGIRLIRKDQIEKFHDQMIAFKLQAQSLEEELLSHRVDILASSKAMLKDRFNLKCYPDRWSLNFRWGFPVVEIPSYLETMAPKAFEAEKLAILQQGRDSVELAVSATIREFSSVVANWVDRLGPVITIHPSNDSAYVKYRDGEILSRYSHLENSEIPEGMIRIAIRYPNPQKKGTSPVVELQMTAEEYADLRPVASTTKCKRFTESTVESMFEMINRFRNLGETMSADEELVQLMDAAAKQLQQFNSVGGAVRELKGSAVLRNQVHTAMSQLSKKLDEFSATHNQGRRKVYVGFNRVANDISTVPGVV